MKTFVTTLILCALTTVIAKADDIKTVVDTIFNRVEHEEDFAFGADISWLSQQESWGTYYCGRSGKKMDLMTILKDEEGVNAVRFRVWVNPSGGWSGKQDVVNLCKRAHAKGMKIMISFHYSDTWADSSSQTIPSQWTDHSVSALAQKVYDHTFDVLNALKKEGIVPKWVSIGNETKYGMLYDVGKTKSTDGYKNFVTFINKAYQAIKDVDPSMKALIHLPNAHDLSTAKNMFNNLNKYGANYDIIGLSAYPRWSHLDVTTDSNIKSTINTYMTTFKSLKSTFNKPVMVVETGHYCDQPLDGNRFLAEFMKALIEDGELGCFYWEPEAMDNSGYNLGAWSSTTHQATIAMDAFKGWKHTQVDKYMTVLLRNPSEGTIYNSASEFEMKIYAKSSNTVTHISNVDFYLNGKLQSSQTAPASTNTYIYADPDLKANAYTFHALVSDNQNHVQSTDTVSVLVGPATIFQENASGYGGITSGSIQTSLAGFTGEGYLESEKVRKATATWYATFPEAGTYTIVFRYFSDTQNTTKIFLTDESNYTLATFPSTDSSQKKWKFISKNITVDSPDTYAVSIQSMNARGLPSIDFMALISPEGVAPVTYSDATSVPSLPSTGSGTISNLSPLTANRYNLSGQRVGKDYKGIVVINGRKYLQK